MTTLGLLGSHRSSGVLRGLTRVAISVMELWKQQARVSSNSGSIKGSSPWMLMTTSKVFLVSASIKSRASTDRKSTRLNSSHVRISYAVFCLKKKKDKAIYATDVHRATNIAEFRRLYDYS